MKIILLSDDAIRLEGDVGAMTIEAVSAEQGYSPFHMLASGLALCTYSILHSWAETVSIPADDLAVEVSWQFADNPHRVGAIDVSIDWASLPTARIATAQRVTELCAIHATLSHPPTISISRASVGGASA